MSPRKSPFPFYKDLRAWRGAARLNQRSAAKVLGMSQTRYSRLERGVLAVKGPDAKRIVTLTGVPLEVVVGIAS